MTEKPKKTLIKISGTPEAIQSAAKLVESVFPIFIESKPKKNDNDEFWHIFISVPATEA